MPSSKSLSTYCTSGNVLFLQRVCLFQNCCAVTVTEHHRWWCIVTELCSLIKLESIPPSGTYWWTLETEEWWSSSPSSAHPTSGRRSPRSSSNSLRCHKRQPLLLQMLGVTVKIVNGIVQSLCFTKLYMLTCNERSENISDASELQTFGLGFNSVARQ